MTPIQEFSGDKPSKSDRRRMKELEDGLAASQEWKRIQDIKQLEESLNVFRGNSREIIQALELALDMEVSLKLWEISNRMQLDDYLREVARLLHNFVASALSLVDHSRVFFRTQAAGTPIYSSLQERIRSEFSEDPQMRFVQGLRNYFLHKRVPPLISKLDFTGEGPRHLLILQRNDIADFDWDKCSKQFLDSTSGTIDIAQTILTYHKRVIDLWNSIFEELRLIHRIDLEAIEEAHRNMRIVFGRGLAQRLRIEIARTTGRAELPENAFLFMMSELTFSRIYHSHADPIERGLAYLTECALLDPAALEMRQEVEVLFRTFYQNAQGLQGSPR